MSRRKNKKQGIIPLILIIAIVIYNTYYEEINTFLNKNIFKTSYSYQSIEEIPEYTGNIYVVLNNNEPTFTASDLSKESFERYSSKDYLDRCGVSLASIGKDLMPSKDRGSIGSVKPSGWHTVKYDIVDGKYLYNRCHLIGYQLSGENANPENLITCTRQANVEGMLPFEEMVAEYVKETNNHVMYRVTPIFEGDNLLASGIQMEALSVEDNGKGVKFNVYIYNVQDGIEIDYSDGSSKIKK